MSNLIQSEQNAFDQQLPQMLEEHPGEFVVFHGGKPLGFFSAYDQAYSFALDELGLDEVFLVSQVISRDAQPASISWYAGVMFG
jgi:hypothetical protein